MIRPPVAHVEDVRVVDARAGVHEPDGDGRRGAAHRQFPGVQLERAEGHLRAIHGLVLAKHVGPGEPKAGLWIRAVRGDVVDLADSIAGGGVDEVAGVRDLALVRVVRDARARAGLAEPTDGVDWVDE